MTISLIPEVCVLKAGFDTIYIRADGSIDPPTAPISTFDKVTYTFTDSIFDEIVVERDNVVIDGVGYGLEGTGLGTGTGIYLSGRTNVTIQNTRIKAFERGIDLYQSSNNSIYGNNITANIQHGIALSWSSNNSVSGNTITNNGASAYGGYGVALFFSCNNSVSGNTIMNNKHGVGLLFLSNSNTISGNTIIANNEGGIDLSCSSDFNIVSGNTIANNLYGIWLSGSLNKPTYYNRIYHNNFKHNIKQAYDEAWENPEVSPSINVWDNGYPSGGNYWSDYVEKYPNASEIDASGVWNTPYVIDANNTDRYPLKAQYVIPEFSPILILPLFMIATLLAVIIYRKKGMKTRQS